MLEAGGSGIDGHSWKRPDTEVRAARPWQDGSWQPLDPGIVYPHGAGDLEEASQAHTWVVTISECPWLGLHWSWAV